MEDVWEEATQEGSPVLGCAGEQLNAHQSFAVSQLPPGRWKRESGKHT